MATSRTGATTTGRVRRTAHLALTPRPDPLVLGFILATVIYCLAIASGVVGYGTDARIWWASRPPDPYLFTDYVAGVPGFYYSPAFSQVLAPVTSIVPEPVFVALWTASLMATLLAVVGRWAVAALLYLPVPLDISAGNIHLLLAAVAMFGFRWPALWAFALLTKVSPGVGLLWFAARGEWRSVALALGATTAIAAVSLVQAPELWLRWIDLLAANVGAEVSYPHASVRLLYRLPLAALLVVWGARTDRRWTLPMAAMLSLPVIWPGSFAMLVAIAPLRQPSRM